MLPVIQKQAVHWYLHLKMSKHSRFIYVHFDKKMVFWIQMFCFSSGEEQEQQQDVVLFSTHKQHNSRLFLNLTENQWQLICSVMCVLCTGLRAYNSYSMFPRHSGDDAELMVVRHSKLSAALCCVFMCEIEEWEIAAEYTMGVLSAKTLSECSKVHCKRALCWTLFKSRTQQMPLPPHQMALCHNTIRPLLLLSLSLSQ